MSLVASSYCGSDTVKRSISYDLILSAEDYRDEEINIYPNPLSSNQAIQVSVATADHYAISAASGRIICPATPLRDSFVHVPPLQPGIYLLYLYRKNKTIAIKKVLVL